MRLFSDRNQILGTENAFKIGPHIVSVESRGESVVRLNLGEPDFDIPPFVKDEIKAQLDKNNTHYCDPQGLLSLRKAIAKQISDTRFISVTPDRVVVFPGGKPSIGFTQQIYCNPGDEVIYPSPGFPIYESFVRYVGAKPVPLHLIEESNFTFTADQFAALITPKTKIIILNFPSNPTGGVATKEQLMEIADVILKKCDSTVRVYSDEIYENILFDGKKHFSIASIPGIEERTIISSGFSKSFAWTGGRIGYAVLPTKEEADAFKNLNINYFSCIPPYNQEGAREALENPQALTWVANMVKTFEKRRDVILNELNAIDGIHCQKPGGAFYLFPNIRGVCEKLGVFDSYNGLDENLKKQTSPSTLFQMFALYNHKVAVMDRRSFGAIGSDDEHFLRISIAAELTVLQEGVKRLKAASEDAEGFRSFVARGENLF